MNTLHKYPNVVVPFVGRFKGQASEQNMSLPVVKKTNNGLELLKWIDSTTVLMWKDA